MRPSVISHRAMALALSWRRKHRRGWPGRQNTRPGHVLMSMPALDHFADVALGAKGLTTAPLWALTPALLTRRRRRMGVKEPPGPHRVRNSRPNPSCEPRY